MNKKVISRKTALFCFESSLFPELDWLTAPTVLRGCSCSLCYCWANLRESVLLPLSFHLQTVALPASSFDRMTCTPPRAGHAEGFHLRADFPQPPRTKLSRQDSSWHFRLQCGQTRALPVLH